jgi:hypothetical protein
MPIYTYLCHRGHALVDAIRPMECAEVPCPRCGGPMERSAANRVAVTIPEIDMRGKFRRYEEATQEQEHLATKVEQSTGQAVQAPPLWRMAKQKAQAMLARGEAPPMHKEQMQ